MLQPSMTKIRVKITYLKFHSYFPGANIVVYLGPGTPWNLANTELNEEVSLVRCQTITWTNANSWSIWSLGTNFNKI